MSSLKPAPKFLLDENVRRDLYRFLKARAVDVGLISKSTSDSNVALKSKGEGRVLVTNDRDFCKYDKNEIFSCLAKGFSKRLNIFD